MRAKAAATYARCESRIAAVPYAPAPKRRIRSRSGDSRGFMKIAVDAKTRQILGAAILGAGADVAIHCIIDAMFAKAPFTAVQRAVRIHPTVAELLPTLLGELKPLG